MKKYLNFLLIAGLLLFNSCESALDLQPTTQISGDMVWKDASLVQAYQAELYNCLLYAFRVYHWTAKASDEAYPSMTQGPNLIQRGMLTPDNVSTTWNATRTSPSGTGQGGGNLYYWDHAYRYIRKLNIFFENIVKPEVEVENKDRMIAEAKFLKAYIYFNLLIRFGEFPIVDDYWELDQGNEIKFTSNTFDECVAEIEKLVADAIPGLPKMYHEGSLDLGRITQDICRAMLSRMYLYLASPLYSQWYTRLDNQAKWQKAADASKNFLDSSLEYELYPSYREAFIQRTGVENKEFILARYFTSTNGHYSPMDMLGRRFSGYGGWWASNGPTQALVDDYDMQSTGLPPFIWQNGEKVINPASGYDPQNPYHDRDPRLDGTVIHEGTEYRGETMEFWISSDNSMYGFDSWRQSTDNPRSNYILKKFMPDVDQALSWSVQSTIPFPIFRLGEIYLNYAEAMFELGDEDVCREYINKLRLRADMPPLPESVTGEELRQRLYNERRIELAFEEHRYFDVRRWKIAPITETRDIYGMQIIRDMSTGVKTYTPELLLNRGPNFWDDKFYLLPISTTEIRRNEGSLQQTITWR